MPASQGSEAGATLGRVCGDGERGEERAFQAERVACAKAMQQEGAGRLPSPSRPEQSLRRASPAFGLYSSRLLPGNS